MDSKYLLGPPRCGKLAARMETSPGEVDVERLGRMMMQVAEGAG